MSKVLTMIVKYSGVLTIIALWLLLAKPYFIDSLVPFPSRQLVSSFSPWDAYDKYAGPVKNNAMPDIITQIYPWKHFAISEIKQGKLPVWNPYNFSGYPQLANFQTAIFSPFTLLYLVLPFIDAWSLIILLQPLIAGLFTYLLLREFKISKSGATLGSISFMFCGFMIVWMMYGTLSMAITFLPLALFAIERFFRTKRLLILFLLSGSVAISLFSGHFQTSIYLCFFIGIFLLYKALTTKEIRSGLLAGGALVLGLLLSLIQLLPTFVFYTESLRSISSIVDDGIPLYYLTTIFSPDFFGNPVTRNDWVGFYAERASFIGIIPFILAFVAISFKRIRIVLFFAIMGVVSLFFALDTPFQTLLSNLSIPVLSSSNPTRIIVLWSFSFSLLAGFGVDTLRSLIEKKRIIPLLRIVISFAVLLGSVWVSLILFSLLPSDKISLAMKNLILPTGIFILFAIGVIGTTIIKFPKKKELLVVGIIMLTAFDSFRFANKWISFDSRELVFPDVPVIQAMKNLQGEGRVFGDFGLGVPTFYGIASIEGYDPLYIRRYGEFIKAATTGEYSIPDRSAVSLDRQSKNVDRVLDFLSVSLVYHRKSHTFQNWAYPVWADKGRYKVVYEDDIYQLFQNTKALSRARLFYDYEVISDPKAVLRRFYQKDFPYKDRILLEEKIPFEPSNAIATGTATITHLEPAQIRIKTVSSHPGLLLLADPYYPQWEATVNGKPTKIYQGDYAFRVVIVPKGEAEVEFTYSYF